MRLLQSSGHPVWVSVMAELSQTSTHDAYSSVELARNTKGYNWTIKVYVAAGDEQLAIVKVRMLDEQMRAEYGEQQS